MLKMSSKRRRTQAQIKADKEEAANKEAQAAAQSFEIAQLKQQVAALQQENQKGTVATNFVGQLIDSGLVNQGDEGEFVVQPSDSPSKFKPMFDE